MVTLTTNRRQAGADQQWEREALVALREGKVAPAVTAYADHGRVTIAGTIDEARQRLVEDWWAVHRPSHTTAILAVRRVDVAALNEMVRARRQAGGELGEELRIGDEGVQRGGPGGLREEPAGGGSGRARPDRRQAQVRIRNGTFATVVGRHRPDRDSALAREGDVARNPRWARVTLLGRGRPG